MERVLQQHGRLPGLDHHIDAARSLQAGGEGGREGGWEEKKQVRCMG